MKKAVFSLILLVTMLTSCADFKKYFLSNQSTDIYDFVDTDESADVDTEHRSGKHQYVVNKKTKTYHLSTCTYAQKTSENNKEYFSDKTFLEERGYTSCKKCIK